MSTESKRDTPTLTMCATFQNVSHIEIDEEKCLVDLFSFKKYADCRNPKWQNNKQGNEPNEKTLISTPRKSKMIYLSAIRLSLATQDDKYFGIKIARQHLECHI